MIPIVIIICIFTLLLLGMIMYFSVKFEDSDFFKEPEPRKVNVFDDMYADEIKLINASVIDEFFEGALYRGTSVAPDCCIDNYTYVFAKRCADEEGRIKALRLAEMENLVSAELIKGYNRRFANCYSPGFDFSKVITVDLRSVEGRILVKRMYL